MLNTSTMVVQALQIVATAAGTYMVCFAATDAKLARLAAEIKTSQKELDENQRRLDEALEIAEAAKRQRERDLERWSDGLAASFGTELEDVSERLMVAMLACKRGEDVTATLFEIHDDLCMVVGDMLSMGAGDAE